MSPRAGARSHPLADEHPEWFCRDSAGELIGVYTKAFDNAHPGWQQYFIDSCVALIERLDLDGFRFDAPTYNYFANWSDRTRTHAGVSMIGSLELFRRLRPAVKAVKADAMLYTEPSGVLLLESMDVNYNYDEQWLFPAVVQPAENPHDQEVHNAHELGRWLQHRDALLPAGSITAHHIDPHDTFWWPLPGEKWMREQFGVGAGRALTGVFALSGGAFMMFVGGEEGIEDDLRTIAHLRDTRPELAVGDSDHTAVTVNDPSVYAVVRRGSDQGTLVLVNLASDPARVRATVTPVKARRSSPPPELDDLYAGRPLTSELTTNEDQETTMQLSVELPAYEICVVALP